MILWFKVEVYPGVHAIVQRHDARYYFPSRFGTVWRDEFFTQSFMRYSFVLLFSGPLRIFFNRCGLLFWRI